jgi:hypothetical protein
MRLNPLSRSGARRSRGRSVAEADLRAIAALSPIDVEQVVAVRRITNIAFERGVCAGDVVTVEVSVDHCRNLSPEQVVVETTWRAVNQTGQSLVRFGAELVCRRDSDGVGTDTDQLDADQLQLPGDALDADFACVDNIPV